MQQRILIVEDDPNVALVLEDALSAEGYTTEHASDGRHAVESALARAFDLTLLDVGLPDKDGFAVCDELRRQGVQMPILLLTARTAPDDKVRGLRMGADDYVTKPFHVPELLARIQALLRRTQHTQAAILIEYRFGDVFVDFYRGRATKAGRPVELTTKELVLLRYLIARRGLVVSREELLTEVWGYHSTNTRTVDVHIATLRQKLEDHPHAPLHVLTVRGGGYQFQHAPM
ncbi:MAG: response regulator transcription factor [Bryobacterales bacterium]|nr:response regulator transcription factor [Bryobacterales bacterium]